MPCRDEVRFIGPCLESIAQNDFPKDQTEVLVVDGMSTDGSREIIDDYTRKHSFIHSLDNPERITPTALNRAVRRATGDFVIWMSAHNEYERDYISRSVKTSQEYGADAVGGIMVTRPRKNTLMGRSIAAVLSHCFGVGNSAFRTHPKEPKWVDTVFGGCYRREVFDRVGLFNERLVRGQDIEFNIRLHRAGGKTLLDPAIITYYFARARFPEYVKHNWTNGVWAILPFLYSDVVPVRLRHLVPLAFASVLTLCALVGIFWHSAIWTLAGIFTLYTAVNLIATAHVAWQKKCLPFLLTVPFAFGGLHFGYGFGSLWGVCEAARLCVTGKSRGGQQSAREH